MSILMPEPIVIKIGGQDVEIKKMTVKQQFKVGAIFEEKPADGLSEKEVIADRMIEVISLVTGYSTESINQGSTIVEVTAAFNAIWKQNGFDRFTKPAETNQV